MEDFSKIFRSFDKNLKGYLTKHELKCALIYITGNKIDYEILTNLWKKREDFYKKIERSTKGISCDYLNEICRNCAEIYPSNDKKLEIEFNSLDIEGKDFIDFEAFQNLYELMGVSYMNEKMQKDVFNKLDKDSDGKITLKDYRNVFVK